MADFFTSATSAGSPLLGMPPRIQQMKKSEPDDPDQLNALALLIGRLTAIATVTGISIRYGWLGLLLPHIIRAIKGL